MQTPLTAIVTLKPENKQAAVDFGIALNAMGDENPVNVALKASNIVHFGRFVFLSEGSQVAIITEFDGSFEDYTNEFVDLLGDVFNSLLALAIDPPPLPVRDNTRQSARCRPIRSARYGEIMTFVQILRSGGLTPGPSEAG